MNTIDKLKIVIDIMQDAEISGINDINHFKGAKKNIEDVIIEINNKCKTCKSLQIKNIKMTEKTRLKEMQELRAKLAKDLATKQLTAEQIKEKKAYIRSLNAQILEIKKSIQ